MNVNIITKDSWKARTPALWPPVLKTPVKKVFCCYSGTIECYSVKKCAQQVKKLQKFHIYMKKLRDITYNFLVGCDGNVYEGRGWTHAADIPDEPPDNTSIYIALIGAFKDRKPPDIVFQALEEFIHFGMRNDVIAPDCTRHFKY